jgi:hypothetical protein
MDVEFGAGFLASALLAISPATALLNTQQENQPVVEGEIYPT